MLCILQYYFTSHAVNFTIYDVLKAVLLERVVRLEGGFFLSAFQAVAFSVNAVNFTTHGPTVK